MKRHSKWILAGFGVCALALCLRFRNTASFLLASVTHRLPGIGHVERIRADLEGQPDFRVMLERHEKDTLKKLGGGAGHQTKRYIYKTPVTAFDMPSMIDYWETWVRTDVVGGKARTSYLVRLGIIRDANAGEFFGKQSGTRLGAWVLRFMVRVYNKMFDWHILMPFRLNITESNATSSVSHTRLELEDWEKLVEGNLNRAQPVIL